MRVYKTTTHAPANGNYLTFDSYGQCTGGKYLENGEFGTHEDGWVSRVTLVALNKPLPPSYILFDGDIFRYVSAPKGKILTLHANLVKGVLGIAIISMVLNKLATMYDSEADFLFTYVKHPGEVYEQNPANVTVDVGTQPMFGLSDAPSFDSLTTDSLSQLLESLSQKANKPKSYCWTLGVKGLTINKESECTATAATPY
jgi:hypothetical protein